MEFWGVFGGAPAKFALKFFATGRVQNLVHIATPTTSFQSSIPPHRYIYSKHSRAPELYTSMPPRPQIRSATFRALEFSTCTPLRRDTHNAPPDLQTSDLHASTSRQLYRASKSPYLHISPCRYTYGAPPELRASIPPRRYACSEHPDTHPYFHVPTPAARL